ncbi:hypothetical protein [Lewinella sp. JB7]|uniref:hypothetical protein n=1 Tax=Lewinella sp. JB7 TaxID=2962887 RepID=UPI0020C9C4CD|nr:hypothetical protein [Lewinella sp. JB7]MCP9234684.1 hypothetical protein [Lewinella sp. JB7]
MRYLIFLLPIFFTYCKSTAGLTIPAQQAFVLGEYTDTGYRAGLTNTGTHPVSVRLVDREGEVEDAFTLLPGERKSVVVGGGQNVRLVNAAEREATVYVVMSRGVEGMRYEPLGGEEMTGSGEEGRRPNRRAAPVFEDLGPGLTAYRETIPPGQQLVLGEGSAGGFTTTIRTGNGEIEVSGRDKRSGEQLQGFGLRGRETVTIRPRENLHLLNPSDRMVRIRVTFDREVVGARLLPLKASDR